jgi:transposase InsO family protein
MREEVVMDIVKRVDFARERTGLPLGSLCRSMGVSFRTFRRWNRRRGVGTPLLRPPGPAKTGAFDPLVLAGELASLSHGAHRTARMGLLYGKYGDALSRRELACMAEEIRKEQNADERRNLRRVEWLVPGICWALDGTTYNAAGTGKQEILTVRDLCSKYLFRPLVTQWTPCCLEVVGHTEELLHIHDLPLLMKMDNGGNLIGHEHMESLAGHRVMPFISPPGYPEYNGSLENAQGDVKEAISKSLPLYRSVPSNEFRLHAELAMHELNHRPRECLGGKNPCQVYHGETRRKRFTQPERMAIYDWINETTESILKEVRSVTKQTTATARRKATEAWLVKNNIIRITLNGLSVTQF